MLDVGSASKGIKYRCCPRVEIVMRSRSSLLIRSQPGGDLEESYAASPGWTSRSGCPGYAKLFSLDLVT